ncbi:hydroxyphenylacetyl-CoA thioesterase PaaI [Caulobacter sp. SSI4214]|uniref:hydroxyphenylacetyl-CoA thioesterase PaaI n=1 Tax=Caulobacter sp. SSI4214 TaxID=2575739 RepID=UPI00143B65B2|nr:hydroxyphenylacetyl-CoA thioesterase PaaI [Caulobacter sp. SSI4214]
MNPDETALRVAMKLRAGEGPTVLFGLGLEAVAEGFAKVSMRVVEEMLNGVGTCHGGVLFTLADTAFAYACNSRNSASVAQHAAISFLNPVHLGQTVWAEARETAIEGRTGVYSVIIRTEDGQIAATFEGLSRTLGRSILPLTEDRLAAGERGAGL